MASICLKTLKFALCTFFTPSGHAGYYLIQKSEYDIPFPVRLISQAGRAGDPTRTISAHADVRAAEQSWGEWRTTGTVRLTVDRLIA